MDVISVFQVLVRRWAVVLPVVLLGVAGTVYAASTIPDEYTASGSLIVVDRSGGAGEVTPAIVAEALQDGATRDAVAAATGSGSYSVTADQGGILRVSAGAADRGAAVATANAVVDQIQGVVDARQSQSGGATTPASVEILNRATDSSVLADENGLFLASASARLIGAGGTAIGGDRVSKLLTEALGSVTVREQIAAAGGVGDYSVKTSRDLPTITIAAVATTSSRATTTVDLVRAAADEQLVELLAIQGSSAAVAAEPLVASGGVTVDSTGVLRSVIALLALTVGVGVAAAFVTEGVAEHRRSRNEGNDPVAGGESLRRSVLSATEPRSMGKASRTLAGRPRSVPKSGAPGASAEADEGVADPAAKVDDEEAQDRGAGRGDSGHVSEPTDDRVLYAGREDLTQADPFPDMPARTR